LSSLGGLATAELWQGIKALGLHDIRTYWLTDCQSQSNSDSDTAVFMDPKLVKIFLLESLNLCEKMVHNLYSLQSAGCFKKSCTTLKIYINLFRGHVQCFELA
jgi:hypothetical protein